MTKDCLTQNLLSLKRHHPSVFSRIAAFCGSADFLGSSAENHEATEHLHDFHYPKIVVFYGIGDGRFIKEFWQNRLPSVRHVILIEKSVQAFISAMQNEDLSTPFSSEQFELCLEMPVSGMNDFTLRYLLSHEDRLICSDRIENAFCRSSLAGDGEYYLEFSKALSGAVKNIDDHGQFAPCEDNWRGLMNIMKNADAIRRYPLIDCSAGYFQGQKAILAGAGPSLSNEMENIKKYRDRYFLMACDAAVVPLQKNGIDPDFIVVVERLIRQKHLFLDGHQSTKACLLTLPSVHPEVLALMGQRPTLFLKRHATFSDWIHPSASFLPDVPRAVIAAGYTALKILGFSEIYILGNNLSLDPDSPLSHVSGSHGFVQGFSEVFIKRDLQTVNSYTGAPLKTMGYLKQALGELEEQIESSPDIKSCHVIDPDKGAKISGATQITPKAFWKSISEMPPQIMSWDDFLTRVNQHEGTDLGPVRDRTLKNLEEKKRQCVKFLSLIRDEHLILMTQNDETIFSGLESTLSRWRRAQNEICDLKDPAYVDFTCCLFSSRHVEMLSFRESLVPDRDGVRDYVSQYVELTFNWGIEFLGWMERCLYLLNLAENSSSEGLERFRFKCLDFADWIIRDYHDRFDLLDIHERRESFSETLNLWKERENQIKNERPDLPWSRHPEMPDIDVDLKALHHVFSTTSRFVWMAGWVSWMQKGKRRHAGESHVSKEP